MLYAFDAKTGKIKWEREAVKMVPTDGRHRKNTYASETPFTDGERVYASFGQNVGLFVYSMDGTPLWSKQWPPQPIYLDFGTASSPIVHDGRVYLVNDNEKASIITALDAKTGAEVWTTPRALAGRARVILDDAVRLEPPRCAPRSSRRRWAPRSRRARREGAVADHRDADADCVRVLRRRRFATWAPVRRGTRIVRSWRSSPARAGTSR